MNPDQVVNQLQTIGVDITRPTITRYERQGLISPPQRGSHGRGVGRWTEYPECAIHEAYAAWALINARYNMPTKNVPKVAPEVVWYARMKARSRYIHGQGYFEVIPLWDNFVESSKNVLENFPEDEEPDFKYEHPDEMKYYIKYLSFVADVWTYLFNKSCKSIKKP